MKRGGTWSKVSRPRINRMPRHEVTSNRCVPDEPFSRSGILGVNRAGAAGLAIGRSPALDESSQITRMDGRSWEILEVNVAPHGDERIILDQRGADVSLMRLQNGLQCLRLGITQPDHE